MWSIKNVQCMEFILQMKRIFQAIATKIPFLKLKPNNSIIANAAVMSKQEIRKEDATHDYKSAIRELSQQNDLAHKKHIDFDELKLLSNKPIEDLTVQQLEDLATMASTPPPDFPRAFRLWQAASAKGSVEATYSLAVCTREGKGTVANPEKAFAMLKSLAEDHDHGYAHFAMGIMYSNGEGVPANDENAYVSFQRAVNCNILPAVTNLGHLLAAGKGVPKDEGKALMCYEAAVQYGDPSAMFTLGSWNYKGRGGLRMDKQKAFQLYLKGAELGHPGAMFNVGGHYLSGEGVSKDYEKASMWFEKAASAGMIPAAMNYCKMHYEGIGNIPKDLHKVKQMLERFATSNRDCNEMLKIVNAELTQKA